MANILARKAASVRANCMQLWIHPIVSVQWGYFGPRARYSLVNTAAAGAVAGGNQQQGAAAQLYSHSPQQPNQHEV